MFVLSLLKSCYEQNKQPNIYRTASQKEHFIDYFLLHRVPAGTNFHPLFCFSPVSFKFATLETVV